MRERLSTLSAVAPRRLLSSALPLASTMRSAFSSSPASIILRYGTPCVMRVLNRSPFVLSSSAMWLNLSLPLDSFSLIQSASMSSSRLGNSSRARTSK